MKILTILRQKLLEETIKPNKYLLFTNKMKYRDKPFKTLIWSTSVQANRAKLLLPLGIEPFN